MAINNEKFVHYEINLKIINEDNFIDFMENLIKKIKNNKIEHYTIFLGNLLVHKYKKKILILFWKQNKYHL